MTDMTRAEQIRRILDEWRTVSEADRQRLVDALADCIKVPRFSRTNLSVILTDIISKRGDME